MGPSADADEERVVFGEGVEVVKVVFLQVCNHGLEAEAGRPLLRYARGIVLSGTGLADVARDQIAACEEAANRMRSGVELLSKDLKVFEAFCLANEVMALQRARSLCRLARAPTTSRRPPATLQRTRLSIPRPPSSA